MMLGQKNVKRCYTVNFFVETYGF